LIHLQDGFDLLDTVSQLAIPGYLPLILSTTLLTELNRGILNSLPISCKWSPRSHNKVEMILILLGKQTPPVSPCSLRDARHPDILFSAVWT